MINSVAKVRVDFGNTSVERRRNLYRFQIDEYPDYDILRVYENMGRNGREKRTKTFYDEQGYPWKASLETGELLRRKTRGEVQRCLDVSLQRTNKVLREIVMSNHWEWFVTLTFNDIEQNRANDKEVFEQFKKWRKDIRKRFPDLYYVAVPERHKNGCIHFHVPMGGVTAEQLKLVYSGKKDENGREIYNCHAWKYGFSTVTKVEDSEKVAGYILKYIGKEYGVSDECKKRYWASKNCNRPKKRFKDIVYDFKLSVASLFDNMVERTIAMRVHYYCKARNYIAVKDFGRSLRRIRFDWDRFQLSAHDDFWEFPRRVRKILTV